MKQCMPSRAVRVQSGASLIVVLILLLVMTLLGLVVLRGTVLEERMSANLYDRSLAFQSAEAALREAEATVRTYSASGVGFDCSAAGVACPTVPPGAFTTAGSTCAATARTQNCWINATDRQVNSAGAPQYYIQYLGQRETTDELSLDSSANQAQYGAGGGAVMESVYRIIARSHSPAGSDRAVVVLQGNVAIK